MSRQRQADFSQPRAAPPTLSQCLETSGRRADPNRVARRAKSARIDRDLGSDSPIPGRNPLARKNSFCLRFQPDHLRLGLLRKYFTFVFSENDVRWRRPASTGGAYRDRHGRGRWDAMDVMAPRDVRCRRGRRSPVVLIPRRWYHALMRKHHAQRWPKSPAHRGEQV
jgi:hypothetical protein